MKSKSRKTYFFGELLALKLCHLDEDVVKQEFQLSPEVSIPTEAQLLKKNLNKNRAEHILYIQYINIISIEIK